MEEVNLQEFTLGWQAGNYSEFWGRTLRDGVELRLGTLNPSQSVSPQKSLSRARDLNNQQSYVNCRKVFMEYFLINLRYIFITTKYVISTRHKLFKKTNLRNIVRKSFIQRNCTKLSRLYLDKFKVRESCSRLCIVAKLPRKIRSIASAIKVKVSW